MKQYHATFTLLLPDNLTDKSIIFLLSVSIIFFVKELADVYLLGFSIKRKKRNEQTEHGRFRVDDTMICLRDIPRWNIIVIRAEQLFKSMTYA